MGPGVVGICWYVSIVVLLLLFQSATGLSTASFPYICNLTTSGNLDGPYQSCYKRCNESNSRSDKLECMCDIHCMFIGDCCYDYLMECDNKQFDMSNALAEQSNFYQRFKQYSDCKFTEFEDATDGPVLQISSCPEGNDELTGLCEGNDGSRLFSWYMPVTARGIFFSNVYCAACHGIRLQEVDIMTTSHDIKCKSSFDAKAQLVPFEQNFRCSGYIRQIANKYKGLGRTCVCDYRRKKMYAYSECDDATFKDECHAYAAVIQPHGHTKVWVVRSESEVLFRLWCKSKCRGIYIIRQYQLEDGKSYW